MDFKAWLPSPKICLPPVEARLVKVLAHGMDEYYGVYHEDNPPNRIYEHLFSGRVLAFLGRYPVVAAVKIMH